MKSFLSQKHNIFLKAYCTAALLVALVMISWTASATALISDSFIDQTRFKELSLIAKNINLKNEICVEVINVCVRLEEIVKPRVHFYEKNSKGLGYTEFPWIIDLNKVSKLFVKWKLNKQKQRYFLQAASLKLNQFSFAAIKQQIADIRVELSINILPIAINNALILSFETQANTSSISSISNLTKSLSSASSDEVVVGIIDSGVSQYHDQLSEVKVNQLNPAEQSLDIKDSGLGHATAILSLLAAKASQFTDTRLLEKGRYLSCNGLPNGKYHFEYILQCMNWLFLQQRVDVIINAWSVPEPGCREEWRYPIAMLFYANSIPTFSAGNYADESGEVSERSEMMDRSPANLNFFEQGFISLTVGALNRNNTRLVSSSFGERTCVGVVSENSHDLKVKPNIHYQANLMALGEDLSVAVPFTKVSFKKVSGTSYAVVFAAAAVAKLSHEFPLASSQQISNALIASATKPNSATKPDRTAKLNLNSDNTINMGQFGYGVIDYDAAREILGKQLLLQSK